MSLRVIITVVDDYSKIDSDELDAAVKLVKDYTFKPFSLNLKVNCSFRMNCISSLRLTNWCFVIDVQSIHSKCMARNLEDSAKLKIFPLESLIVTIELYLRNLEEDALITHFTTATAIVVAKEEHPDLSFKNLRIS
jgi:hypothetical protein